MSGERSKIAAPSLQAYKAESADAFDLLGVLNDAQAYKSSHGDRGWRDRFTLEDINAIIERGDTYIGRVNGTSSFIAADLGRPDDMGPGRRARRQGRVYPPLGQR